NVRISSRFITISILLKISMIVKLFALFCGISFLAGPPRKKSLELSMPLIVLYGRSRKEASIVQNTLYVIGTPIGNLKDITFRAVEVLRDVDFVVAESRERALKLLSHLDIGKPIFTIN